MDEKQLEIANDFAKYDLKLIKWQLEMFRDDILEIDEDIQALIERKNSKSEAIEVWLKAKELHESREK